MYLTTASLALSASWLLWTWAYAAHRGPVPAAWTRSEGASSVVVLVLVLLSATSSGAIVAACLAPVQSLSEQGILSASATIAAPIIARVLTPYLRARPVAEARAPLVSGPALT